MTFAVSKFVPSGGPNEWSLRFIGAEDNTDLLADTKWIERQ